MFSNLLQIVELYDKGNLILTDKDLVILNVLRPRVQGEEKFLVRETYSFDQVRFTYWKKKQFSQLFHI